MLKFLSRVRIEFNALDPRAAACMEFLGKCNAPGTKISNPNCEIQVKRRVDKTRPKIAVTFVNGDKQDFDPTTTPAETISESIRDKSEMVKIEQMFRNAGEKWPVLIPEEELQTPFEDVKVTERKKKDVKKETNMVTLQLLVSSFDKIPEQTLHNIMGPEGK